jgi:hypothetical protein
MAQPTLAASSRAPIAPARLSGIACRHTAAVNRHMDSHMDRLDRPDQHG